MRPTPAVGIAGDDLSYDACGLAGAIPATTQAEGEQQTARYLFKQALRYDAYHREALERLGAIEGRTKVSGSEAVTDTASAWDATP